MTARASGNARTAWASPAASPATSSGAPATPSSRVGRRKTEWRQGLGRLGRTAAAVGAAAGLGAACATLRAGPEVHTAPAPSADERYCAWYGDARAGVLYFAEAPFWWAYRRQQGDPRADLQHPGPQLIGRFDLRRRAFLPSLDLAPTASAGGVWDVLAHPNGRVYFTDFFGASGYVEPASGRVVRFDALGSGLNELALGPEGQILVTRYASDRDEQGSVVVLDAEGALLAEHVLSGPEGWRVAPKSIAWDPVREEIWLNTDLIPTGARPGAALGHDARVLGRDGRERLRFEAPEVQFFAFSADGTGWFAELDGSLLNLRIRPPERAASPVLTGRIVPLDDAFAAGADFVQDIKVEGDVAVVTRWSGRIHEVDREGGSRSLALPITAGGDLYYSGVRDRGQVCATLCGDVEVVCGASGD